jgi:hypothetical protein
MARTPDEVARRALALFAVANAAYERPPKLIRDWLERAGFSRFLSPWEAHFLSKDTASEEEVFAASWRTEALHVLTWALRLVDKLPPASDKADLGQLGITRAILEDPEAFVTTAVLRPIEELETARGEIMDQHWGVRAGPAGRELFGHPASEDAFHPGIVYQRHYAINWLVGGGDDHEDWDRVRTDT